MDLGIQLYLQGVTTSTSYVNVKGTTVALDGTTNLLGAAYLPGGTFYAGRGQQVVLSIRMRFTTATSITLKLESMRSDKNNAALFSWGIVQLSAQDDATLWTGATNPPHAVLEGPELTFTPLAATNQAGYILAMTTSSRLTGACRLSAKANAGSLAATDYIVVGVDA